MLIVSELHLLLHICILESGLKSPLLHIDNAGPFVGQLFLIVIDAYSKWINVYPTTKYQCNS